MIFAHLKDDDVAQASERQLAGAATAVIIGCIQRKNPSEGGCARNFGKKYYRPLSVVVTADLSNAGDGNLAVFLTKPERQARCYGDAGTPKKSMVDSCRSILNKMDVSEVNQFFGFDSRSAVQIPYKTRSGMTRL